MAPVRKSRGKRNRVQDCYLQWWDADSCQQVTEQIRNASSPAAPEAVEPGREQASQKNAAPLLQEGTPRENPIR
jgi:hypothetical protein